MKLGVNIDHVATLRQARGGKRPDPVDAARICQKAGAHSVVMHLREDRRHIQDADLFKVRRAVDIKLNLEMSVAPEITAIATVLRPDQATLVPEKRQEKTTEGGLDLFNKTARISQCIEVLKKRKIPISLFIDPDLRTIEMAKKIGADAIELHTGDYANQTSFMRRKQELARLRASVFYGNAAGLTVHAGHGLDYDNVVSISNIKGIDELNIGYSIVSRALWVGLDEAVRQMLELIGTKSRIK